MNRKIIAYRNVFNRNDNAEFDFLDLLNNQYLIFNAFKIEDFEVELEKIKLIQDKEERNVAKRNYIPAVDFSKHVVLETHFKNENHSLDIWDLKLPDSNYTNRVRFINSCGSLTVTGDFGNWVFCREFHPTSDGYVSDGYWGEKLSISSVQEYSKYDSERTEKEIKQWIRKGLKEYGFSGEELKQKKELFKELLEHTDDELDYTYFAYRESSIDDYEIIPYVKTAHRWLFVVFDAF